MLLTDLGESAPVGDIRARRSYDDKTSILIIIIYWGFSPAEKGGHARVNNNFYVGC